MNTREAGEFATLQQGFALNKKSNHLVYRGGHPIDALPLLRIQDMMKGKAETVFIDSKVGKQFIANTEDIIYTRTGQPGLAFKGFNGVVHNNCFKVNLIKGSIDKEYFFQMISSDFFKNQVLDKSNSSIQIDVNHDLFKAALIPYCDHKTQEEIGKKLKVIDDKIALNNKTINTMATILHDAYLYWFFDFGFIDKNDLEMNALLKFETPKNWKNYKLGDFLRAVSESVPNSTENNMIDLSVIPGDSLLISEYNDSSLFTTNTKKLYKGNYLFASIRPYLHKSIVSPIDGLTTGTVIQFQPKENKYKNYFLAMLTSDSFFSFAVNNSTGTKMPVVNDKTLLKYPFVSDIKTIEKFEKEYDYYDLIISLLNENHTLTVYKKDLIKKIIADIL